MCLAHAHALPFHALHGYFSGLKVLFLCVFCVFLNPGDKNWRDPDYLGALTMWDSQVGRLLGLLKEKGVAERTAIFYTTDNGPHQGIERTDIHYSTNHMRQCKASSWEGGIR